MSLYQSLAKLEAENGAGALCTVVRTHGSTPRHAGCKMLVYPDGSFEGTVGGGELENRVIAEARQAISDSRPRLLEYSMTDPEHGDPGVCGGRVEVFVEPLQNKPVLVVIGAGHVGRAVAHLARWLGFRVVISDDRPEFCTPQAFPEADHYFPGLMSDLPQKLEITPSTFIVLTTRGVDTDVQGLPALMDTPAAYLGVIGSQRRWATTREQLMKMGISEEKINRVHSPVGLEINAETPEEISVSILAQIIMLHHTGNGG
jgi:xanthine dehydrogenase accessory factor